MNNPIFRQSKIVLIAFLICISVNAVFTQPTRNNDKELLQAMEFVNQNRYLDALPLLEKVSPRYPKDAELTAHYGIAVLTNLVTLKDPNIRASERKRAAEILLKAKQLGTRNQIALHYLDGLMDEDIEIDSVSSSASKEVEDLIREGEAFFGRGEYDKAFVAYEKAFKLDPKNYEAALFAGDCFYAQQKFAESEPWFAKAVAINPNREQALRFWGDALLAQGKTEEALSKFADAVIAEPSSRLTWSQFMNWIKQHGKRKKTPLVFAPSDKEAVGSIIEIDASHLKEEDGTLNWKKYADSPNTKKGTLSNDKMTFTLSHPSLDADVKALKAVAEGVKNDTKAGKIKNLHLGLENLLELEQMNLIDAYVLMMIHGGDSCPEFEDFREKKRDDLRRLFVEYLAGGKAT